MTIILIMMKRFNSYELAKKIDHTLIKIDIDMDKLKEFVYNGLKYRFRGLVTTPSNIPILRDLIGDDKGIKLISVIGFPLGQTFIKTKMKEISEVAKYDVNELDIVLNTSLIKLGYVDRFREEASLLTNFVRKEYPDIGIKLITEVTVLPREGLLKAIEIINKVKPDYFKTSTGYGPRGTIVDDVSFVKKYLSKDIHIKAAGGIRSVKQMIELIDAGADIIGSSSGVAIIREAIREHE